MTEHGVEPIPWTAEMIEFWKQRMAEPHQADAPEAIRLRHAVRCALLTIEALVTRVAALEMADRYGTPFDPTGVKNASEIQSLRERNARYQTALEQIKAQSQGAHHIRRLARRGLGEIE